MNTFDTLPAIVVLFTFVGLVLIVVLGAAGAVYDQVRWQHMIDRKASRLNATRQRNLNDRALVAASRALRVRA